MKALTYLNINRHMACMFGCLLLASACAGPAKTSGTKSTAAALAKDLAIAPDGAGLFIQYAFDRAYRAPTSCTLTFVERTSGREVSISLLFEEKETWTAVPPGFYAAGRVTCAGGRVLKTGSLYENGVRVDAGKLSYIGRLTIAIASDGTPSVLPSRRREAASALKASAGRFASVEMARFQSGFTGKRIDLEMLDVVPPETYELHYQLVASGQAVAVGRRFDPQPMRAALSACVDAERSLDPFGIGGMSAHADYLTGAPIKIWLSGANSRSDAFTACVQKALRAKRGLDASPAAVNFRY